MNGVQMKSTNFEFLRPRWPELAGLAGFAECYAQDDPVGALVKLRTFGEQLILFIFDQLHLPRPLKANFLDLLEADPFTANVPRVVLCKLHSLRVQGNRAAHGEKISPVTSLWLLKEAHDLARWLFMTFAGGSLAECAGYVEPPPGGAQAQVTRELQREKKAALEKLAAQEALMQKVLADLEAARARAEIAEASAAELKLAREAGQHAVDTLSFDEAATRKHLIDSMLAKAGWNLGANGQSTDEVGQEVEVQHQPTDSATGYADYVLRDDNDKPLGVVEAKKTAVDVEVGRTQAKCYADGLEKMYGQRPIIFYTNGYDLWMWDDAQQEPPRKIYGFPSKDSLQYRLYQGREKDPLSKIAPSRAIAGRMYQIEAVKRVVEKFAEKKRKALIVQATGTGKRQALSDATHLFNSVVQRGFRGEW